MSNTSWTPVFTGVTLVALLAFATPARADCAAAPLETATDMVVSFLTAGTTQAGPATLFASTVEKGMLVYDGTVNALKYCDGTNWLTLADSGGLGANAAGAAGYVQISDGSGGLTYSGNTAGQEFFWDNTNKRLGLGTATPGYPLDIVGSNPGIHVQHGGGAGAWIQATASVVDIGTVTNHPLRLVTNNTERLRIDTSGNVGIGTATPDAQLHLSGVLPRVAFSNDAYTNPDSATTDWYTDVSNNGDFRISRDGTGIQELILKPDGRMGLGINAPAASALLDLTSTTMGFLPPRMTEAQRDAIASPATGLVIYNTDDNALNYWDGDSWEAVGTGAGGSGNVVAGTYTGNGAASQSINLGFRPKMVIVKGINGTYKPIGITIDGIPDAASHSRIYASNGVAADNSQPKVTATGFNVEGNVNDSGFNYSGTVYHYVAIKDGGGGGSATLAGLTDVDTAGIADGKILKYNGTTTKWEISDDGGGSTGVNVAPTISFSGGGTQTVTLANGISLYQNNTHDAWSTYGTLPSYLAGTTGTDTVNGTPDGSGLTMTISGGSALCYLLRDDDGWAVVPVTGWSLKASSPTDFTSFNPGIDAIYQKVFPPGSYTLDSYSAMYACSTAPVGGGSPTGADGQIQFNNAGDFGADANLVWDDTNNRLGIGTAAPLHSLHVTGRVVGVLEGAYKVPPYSNGFDLIADDARVGFISNAATDKNWSIQNYVDASGDRLRLFTHNDDGSSLVERMSILTASGNVGVGTTSPAATALLDLTATDKGFLPPRMTTAQRDAISSPATGLVVYNTTTSALNFWDGDSWEAVGAGTDVLNSAALSSGTFPQSNGSTIVSAGGSYDLGSMSVEKGVYLWTVYNCAGQLSYSSGAGNSIQIVGTPVIISSSTWSRLDTAPDSTCGHVYTGIFKANASGTVSARISSSSGSVLVKNSGTAFGVYAVKISGGDGGGGGSTTAAGSDKQLQFNDGGTTFAGAAKLLWDKVGESLVIGDTTVADNTSVLDLRSTSKGFLPPRMTTAQRDAIASPATGLTVYNTTTNALNFWDGDSWEAVGTGAGGGGGDAGIWSAVSTGMLYNNNGTATMTDIPGMSVTFNLSQTTTVLLLAEGAIRTEGATSSQSGFGFVIDGTLQGNANWGDAIQGLSGNPEHHATWVISRVATLAAGSHTIKVQASPIGDLRVCSESGGTLADYKKCRLTAIAVGSGGGGGSSTLADLTDVDVAGVANGQTLVWNTSTSTWEAGDAAAGTQVSFYVHRNGANQTVTASAFTLINWTTEVFDTNNNFDTATGKFTPTVPGKYLVNVNVYCTDGTSLCMPAVYKNGTIVMQVQSGNGGGVTALVDMNGSTDYLEAYVYNQSGTTLYGPLQYTNFWGTLIGGGSGGGSGTAAGDGGQIQFNDGADAFAADAALHWDDTNNRLGIGTAAPASAVHVSAAGAESKISITNTDQSSTWELVARAGDTAFAINATASTGADFFFTNDKRLGIAVTPDASAALDVSSTTKGFLPPRMTTAQRDAIASPAAGLTVYNTTTSALNFYTGSAWAPVTTSSASPAFAAKRSASTTVSSNSWLKVPFDSEIFDTNNNFISDRFTPTVPGKYALTGSVYSSNSTGYVHVVFYKNGSPYMGNVGASPGNNGTAASALIDMNGTTDYVELYTYVYGSGTATLDGSSSGWNSFTGHLTGGGGGGGSATAAGSVAGAIQFNDGSDAFAADDVNLVWDDTNKHLGIGSATPGNDLTILQSSDTQSSAGLAVYRSDGSSRSVLFQGADDHGYLFNFGSGGWQFYANQAHAMAILGNGNVGIGTTSPTAPLTVGSTLSTYGAGGTRLFDLNGSFTGSSNDIAGMRLGTSFAPTGSITSAVGLRVEPTFTPGTSQTLASAVGLRVVPSTGASGTLTSATGALFQTNYGTVKPGTAYGVNISNIGSAGITTSYGLYVGAQSGSTNSYAAVFEGGNVGIGTVSPQAKLDVAGKVVHDGVEELNWAGSTAGNQTLSLTFTHESTSSLEITAVFNHYGYINTYGCARKSLVGNGAGVLDAIDMVNVTSANGGAWTFTRNSATSITITKTAGSYNGGGEYFVTVRGNGQLSK